MSRIFPATAACVALLLSASAHAQQPAANPIQAAAAAAQAAAAPIPGICVFSQQDAVSNSLVGKAVALRIEQIAQQVNGELNEIRTKLQADDQALSAQRATMTQEQFVTAAQPLQARVAQFQQLVEDRNQELELTRQNALSQIGQNLDPLLIDSFTANRCSILIEHAAVMLTAPSMDITADAIARLDSKIQTLNVDKVSLPTNGAAPAAAAGPAPARPAAAAPARAGAAPARGGTPAPAAGRGGR